MGELTEATWCVITAPPGSQEAGALLPVLPFDPGQVSSLDLSRFLPACLPAFYRALPWDTERMRTIFVLRKLTVRGDRHMHCYNAKHCVQR